MIWANFELTDTFGGEANYCWVRRDSIVCDDLTNLAVVRRAKKFAGFTGMRCRVDDYGDDMRITPVGRHAPCQTLFITFSEESEEAP